MDRADSLYISPLTNLNSINYMPRVAPFFSSMFLLASGAQAHHYVQTGIWIDLGEAIDEYDCLVRIEGE